MTIDEYASKGFRIGIRPQKFGSNWYWVLGVNVGDSDRADWVDENNGLPWACYNTYEEAFNKAVDYIEKKGNKRSRRS